MRAHPILLVLSLALAAACGSVRPDPSAGRARLPRRPLLRADAGRRRVLAGRGRPSLSAVSASCGTPCLRDAALRIEATSRTTPRSAPPRSRSGSAGPPGARAGGRRRVGRRRRPARPAVRRLRGRRRRDGHRPRRRGERGERERAGRPRHAAPVRGAARGGRRAQRRPSSADERRRRGDRRGGRREPKRLLRGWAGTAIAPSRSGAAQISAAPLALGSRCGSGARTSSSTNSPAPGRPMAASQRS